MTTSEIVQKIQKDAAELVHNQNEDGELSSEKAAMILRYVESSLSQKMTIDEIYDVVKHFDDSFPELQKIVIEMTDLYHEYIRDRAVTKVMPLIEQKNILEANSVLDKAILDQNETSKHILSVAEKYEKKKNTPQ